MIKDIVKEIKANIRMTMKKSGFKVKGSHYVRLTPGKMLHCFGFQASSDGTTFTMNIGIMPLYESGCKWFHEFIRIGQIIGKGDTWWPGTEKSVEEVSMIILNTLLPLLDKCSTYEGFYNEIEEYITIDNENVFPNGGLALYCISSQEMIGRLCLRTGHNDKALICIQNTIRRLNRSRIEVNVLSDDLKDYKKQYAEECEKKISEQKKLEQKVLSNDISDILEEFDSIENENYILLEKYNYNK